jgi:hypothetical protein
MQSAARFIRYLCGSVAVIVFLMTVFVSPVCAYQADQLILPVSSPIVTAAGSTTGPLYNPGYSPLVNPVTVPGIPLYAPGSGSPGQLAPVSPYQAYVPASPLYSPAPVIVPLAPISTGATGSASPVLPVNLYGTSTSLPILSPVLPVYPSGGLYPGDTGSRTVNPVTPVDVQPAKPAVSPEVQRLVEDLKAEYQTSLAAREALAKMGPSVIDAILPLLRDQSYYVRHAAADTLQRLNYQPVTAEERAYYIVGLGNYMEGLDDENYNALVAGGSASVDALIGYLKDPSWMKPSETETMEVLVAIGRPAVPKLIQALNDPVARQDAGIVLLLIGDSQGKQAVTNLMYQQGISLSYYTANYKQILSNYDPYDTTSTDLLWLSLALETNGTKEMAEYFVNAGWPLHLIGEHWANAHGYVVRIKGWSY